ncbi:MAG: thymidine phosphorylase [Spirochaetaceae bacterium]|nr:thymidine phosphorylase [Spirochaetaceae bacterium]
MAETLRAVDIIMKKRGNPINPSGEELSRQELEFLINGYVAGTIPEYQISAWLMAVFFNGMTFNESATLTDIMLHSGDIMNHHNTDIPNLKGPFVDKHSTGGVGDKISLPLAPIVAACGIQVPMMSGRALGHTGGTLDKLESIEGYKATLPTQKFQQLIAKTGFAMTGQTKTVVPADRLLYALRDVTGTVESIPLITASILSKKVAEGSDALVFDVKYGSGAFMKTKSDAEKLALSLVKTAQAMKKESSALITNMQSPLGNKIGNFLEIEETLECLNGKGPSDVMELTFSLAVQMLLLGAKLEGKKLEPQEALNRCHSAVTSGKALELFLQNVADQGGNPDKLILQVGKRRSNFYTKLVAKKDGYISMDAYKIGLSGVYLGVGRNRTEDLVCSDAGFILHRHHGDLVKKGELILEIFGKDNQCLDPALAMAEEAITYSNEKLILEPLIYREIN